MFVVFWHGNSILILIKKIIIGKSEIPRGRMRGWEVATLSIKNSGVNADFL